MTPVSVAAAEFKCAVSTLKAWIKNKTLNGGQARAGGPYFCDKSQAEKLLRDKTYVASVFQIAEQTSCAQKVEEAESSEQVDAPTSMSTESPGREEAALAERARGRERLHKKAARSQGADKKHVSSQDRSTRSQGESKKSKKRNQDFITYVEGLVKKLPVHDKVYLRNRLTHQIDAY